MGPSAPVMGSPRSDLRGNSGEQQALVKFLLALRIMSGRQDRTPLTGPGLGALGLFRSSLCLPLTCSAVRSAKSVPELRASGWGCMASVGLALHRGG